MSSENPNSHQVSYELVAPFIVLFDLLIYSGILRSVSQFDDLGNTLYQSRENIVAISFLILLMAPPTINFFINLLGLNEGEIEKLLATSYSSRDEKLNADTEKTENN